MKNPFFGRSTTIGLPAAVRSDRKAGGVAGLTTEEAIRLGVMN